MYFWAIKKQIQKARIKREYAKAKRAEQTMGTATKGTVDYIKKIGGKVTNFFKENRKVYIAVGVLITMMFLIATSLTSCSALFLHNLIDYSGASYMSTDQAIQDADLYYTQLEANLQERVNRIESENTGYDRYRYQIDEIGHDPFILISYLSAKYEVFEFNAAVKSDLDELFARQYSLSTQSSNETIAKVIGAIKRHDGYMEGNDYIVSWCVGHLVGFCDASEYDERYKKWRYGDLPIVPEKWKTRILDATKKQFSILKKLMHRKDVTEVIAATDAGREGELIFRLVYEKAGCKKPVNRLWISSMEESSIREGFKNMKDGSCYDNLYKSALCRAQADWLVGINASRLFSVLYNHNLKVGRVQTPTLAMIVERNQKVNGFKKEKYFETHLTCGDLHAVSEKFTSKEEADKLAALCQGKMCRVITDEEKEKTVQPPLLYDLTTL